MVNRHGRTAFATEHREQFNSPRFSPDGRRLTVGHEASELWIYDMERPAEPERFTFNTGIYAHWVQTGERIIFNQVQLPTGLY